MTALLGAHLIVAAAAIALARLGRRTLLLCALAPAAVLVWLAGVLPDLVDGGIVAESLDWVPSMDLTIGLRVDAFGAVMVLLVAGIGVLIFGYAYYYFDTDKPDLGRFAATLVIFAGSMFGLVIADNLLALFVFWELTSVTSYLLIGYAHTTEKARASALQALLITGVGGLAMLAGFVILGQEAGTYSMAAMLADPPSGTLATAGMLCVLAGVLTKSAQVPFHSWLPGAMAAPTPVSGYLHSATMVKAGVYLAARFAPAFLVATPLIRPVLVVVGLTTMLIGGFRALRQHDLKLILAYGTVSQLGFLIALFGTGSEYAVFAGVALLLAHGIFKATLFMVVGVIDHATGTRDIRRLDALGHQMRPLAVIGCVAAASMAGLPPLAGFIAKEAAYEGFLETGDPAAIISLVVVVIGSVLTFAYSVRFCWGAFGAKSGPDLADEVAHPHRVAVGFWAPAAVLTAATVALGLLPALDSQLVGQATVALVPDAHPHPLALWHGLNLALGLSAITIATGLALAMWRRPVEIWQERMPSPPGSLEGYNATLRGISRLSGRTAAIMQSGSLPAYLTIILLVAVVAPSAALLSSGTVDLSTARFADSPLQVVAVVVTLIAAWSAARSRRRFSAVLALGAVGYAVVALFALHGAPDLAFTQLLIETVSLLVFVLVLRHLPDRFEVHRWRLQKGVRLTLAVAVGVFVPVFALTAAAARRADSVSLEFLTRSYAEANGRNVVNVILVDFRGMDTLGEITVLAVAGLGIGALVSAVRQGGAPEAIRQPVDSGAGTAPVGPTEEILARSDDRTAEDDQTAGAQSPATGGRTR
ncbi:MAG TPA: hydrogen gas-evolving membrane-bound hydrogenase subunit E [Euzebya sp.]|nr:hydrogen gas-evolving membrane-bound hydrogenase subunit E [Euzebya sp.]